MKTPDANATIPLRPLGLVKNLAEAVGLDVTHVYDDLVFVKHNAFLLQMGANRGEELLVWFNAESNNSARPEILSGLEQTGRQFGLIVSAGGTFSLSPNDHEESFTLHFHEGT